MPENSPAVVSTLAPKRLLFVLEYLKDRNGKQAAIRAGYAAGSADVQASRLLALRVIKDEVDRLGAELYVEAVRESAGQQAVAAVVPDQEMPAQDILRATVKRVLLERERLAFHDPRKFFRDDGSLKNPTELDDDTAMALAGVKVTEMAGGMQINGEDGAVQHVPMYTKELKFASKDASLTALEKTLGMYRESGADNSPLSIHIHL